MRYFACVVVFFCFYMNVLYGQQNLVLNPSFEDVNEEALLCRSYLPNELEMAIENWKSVIGSADIYHMSVDVNCQSHPLNTSFSLNNFLPPKTGKGMVAFGIGLEAIQGELQSPLIAGNKYKIKFYTSLANNSGIAINNFGIKFLQEPYDQVRDGYNLVPDVNYIEVIRETEGWYLVESEFTPQISGQKYFVINNFFPLSETRIEPNLNRLTNFSMLDNVAYYYFDDVSIVDLTPSFQAIGSFCKGAIFTLPEVSDNGWTGSWSPTINNQETTTYTFTPDNAEAESVTLIIEIIEPHIEPIFDIETTICKGMTITLPSVSENEIVGSWSPEAYNQETTTYTFTPEAGSCGLETTVTIEVVDQITPEFSLPSFICEGNPLVLPEVSNNGIRGVWTPAIDNQQTTTYTFTPVGHDCAIPVTATVEVKRIDTLLLNSYCTKNELYVEVVHPDLEHQFQWQINGIAIEELSPLVNLSKYANLLHDHQNRVTVRMTNPSGCVTTNTIEIENKNLCLIPKGISPQGDGLNDTFDISHFGGVSLQIFNRYGMKVYNKKNYQNEWFGQTNSSNTLLPSGTYFYQIVTHRGEVFTGWVQLMY
ncbi:gliding motility-associated C-terminal domain-containing protein [Myroides sp. 1354]|uniref:gliding motility-associated C-terminal domain-containing protein n=1 Tax=unclassified Myroides TaxID=2642485 RepID=UPI00257733A1|nr:MULTISPECIES: gliding motility-associated C-terminal domain-containing protein [unclassified Myroides]MDM1044913.1 gliding motility-associated C-terminal domain-containing protein [Myroides sp. R163-1]MDM1055626.1 gliding motility-associated C-terminal domain-containing protein [Myroides sp. 1354]MDM1068923.1 gliding motility-associated C-terminal domain-containing protein [Myroides sp. 1372]